jgi:hypothetical protein
MHHQAFRVHRDTLRMVDIIAANCLKTPSPIDLTFHRIRRRVRRTTYMLGDSRPRVPSCRLRRTSPILARIDQPLGRTAILATGNLTKTIIGAEEATEEIH